MTERMETPIPFVYGPMGLPVLAAAVPQVIPSADGRSPWALGMWALGAFSLGMVYGAGPGHPRLMMRGLPAATFMTSRQSLVFGLSGALSHSAVIFAFATAAAHLGARLHAAASRPVLHVVVGVVMGIVAAWTYFRSRHENTAADVAERTVEFASTASPVGSESLRTLAGRGILGGFPMASSAAAGLILIFLLSEDRTRGIALAAAFVAGFTAISSSLTDSLAKGARSGRALKDDATWRPSAAWSGVLACLAIYVVCESWTLSRPTFSP